MVGLIAGGPGAVVTSVEGAEDSAELARADLDGLAVTAVDTVVGVSASGRTPTPSARSNTPAREGP